MYPSAMSEARHRLLEGFVLRLARRPDADLFVLRGGMRVRQWFPALGRPALDLDLVYTLPFDVEALRQRLQAVLAVPGVADGVAFRADRCRFDTIWADTAAPGLRMRALGKVDGRLVDLRVDVTSGLVLWPAPERGLFQAPRGEATLWLCRPESIVGRKLQVIAGLGDQRWRPKDLNDLRLILGQLTLEDRALGLSLDASLEGCAESLDDVRETFSCASWWAGPGADGRWQRFVQDDSQGADVPGDLSCDVAEIRSHLRPLLERHR